MAVLSKDAIPNNKGEQERVEGSASDPDDLERRMLEGEGILAVRGMERRARIAAVDTPARAPCRTRGGDGLDEGGGTGAVVVGAPHALELLEAEVVVEAGNVLAGACPGAGGGAHEAVGAGDVEPRGFGRWQDEGGQLRQHAGHLW